MAGSATSVPASLVLNRMFPPLNAPIELDHYTTFAGFSGIISSEELRLYWIKRNLTEDELSSFALDHRLHGYILGPTPYVVELSEGLFYCSMTRPGSGNENRMWEVFGDDNHGVRLRFRVNPGAAELRPMYYGGAKPTLLRELNRVLESKTGRIFLPSSISKIGAFYLPLGYEDESEVRLLLRRTPNLTGWGVEGAEQYCGIPINRRNPICALDLVSVTLGQYTNNTAANNLLAGSKFLGVPVL
jgi:hypothetical protein